VPPEATTSGLLWRFSLKLNCMFLLFYSHDFCPSLAVSLVIMVSEK